MKKCECGGTFIYDGYDEIEINENDLLVISGECKCNKCGTDAYYKEYHNIDFNNPINVELDYCVDGID